MHKLSRSSFGSAIVLLLLTPNAISSQCMDPPTDGTFIEYTDQIVTLTDNYITCMDVRIPTVAPSACGWPMLVLVHTSGTSRDMVNPKARMMAARGFATVTYDVRGQGPGMELNDPEIYGREIMGIRERLDMFEIMEEAERLFPEYIDMNRIGVTGRSQGALHSFLAAAHSGKAFPPNPWRTAPAPVIKAIAPINFGPEFLNSMVPDNQTFSEMMARQLFEGEAITGIHHPPDFLRMVSSYVVAKEFEELVTTLFDPALDPTTLLQDSSVSIMAQLAWDDKYGPINQLLRSWETYLTPGTRKLLSHTTSGHGTAVNLVERAKKEYRRAMFFEQELKGIERGLDDWAKYRFAITPIKTTAYQDQLHLWDVIESDVYPLPGTSTQSYFLGPGNSLYRENQTSVELYSLSHRTNGGTQQEYLNQLPKPEELVNGTPMNTVEFIMPPIEDDVLLLGIPKMSLRLKCPQPDFQVSVALFDHTNNRYMASGVKTIRDHDGSDEVNLELEMGMSAYFLPKNTVLRAEIRNIAWHQIPLPHTYLYAMPIFADYDLTLRTGGVDAAKLELPLLQYSSPILTATMPFLLTHKNQDGNLALRCHDGDTKGWSFQILAGISGTSPGSTINGIQVPLNFDPLTNLIYSNPASLPIANFGGTLDSNSEAIAHAYLSQLPFLPSNISQIDICAVIVAPDGTGTRVSNVVHLEFD
jgi:hypothetical protein